MQQKPKQSASAAHQRQPARLALLHSALATLSVRGLLHQHPAAADPARRAKAGSTLVPLWGLAAEPPVAVVVQLPRKRAAAPALQAQQQQYLAHLLLRPPQPQHLVTAHRLHQAPASLMLRSALALRHRRRLHSVRHQTWTPVSRSGRQSHSRRSKRRSRSSRSKHGRRRRKRRRSRSSRQRRRLSGPSLHLQRA